MNAVSRRVGETRENADFLELRQVAMDETDSCGDKDHISLSLDVTKWRVLSATEGQDDAGLRVFWKKIEQQRGEGEQITEPCLNV